MSVNSGDMAIQTVRTQHANIFFGEHRRPILTQEKPCPPLYLHLPDGSWRSGLVVHDYYQLFIHFVILIECVVTLEWFLLYTWQILLLSILERDPPLLLSWRFLSFFPCECFFLLFLRSFSWSDVRSWDRDLIRVQIVKPFEANL